MQPTFDRGRATWHDAQIRHTMDPPSKQDGRGALHRHDLDGRDHDRHQNGWRAPCNEWYRTCQNTRRFRTAHLDPAAPGAGHAILCRVRVPGRDGAGPAPQHHEASRGFCMLAQRWKSTSMTTKAWRQGGSRPQLFRRQSCRAPRWLPKSTTQNASCICAARTASTHRNPENQCRTEGAPGIVPMMR